MSFFFKGAHALSPCSRLCDSYKFLLWKASPEVRCCNEHSGKQITHFEQVPSIFVRTMQRRATVANYGYRLLVMTGQCQIFCSYFRFPVYVHSKLLQTTATKNIRKKNLLSGRNSVRTFKQTS